MTEDEMKLLQSIADSRKIPLEQLLEEIEPSPKFAEPTEPVVAPSSANEEPVVMFVKSPQPAPETEPPLPPADEEPAAAESLNPEFKSPTEAEPSRANFGFCRQCGWDQRIPPIAEPSRTEILDFLYVSLGRQAYSKEYVRFGGRVKIRLRTLYIRELEALYEAAYKAQKSGIINTPTEYYDYVNRMRLYLQVSHLVITGREQQVVYSLPDVLDKTYLDSGAHDWVDKLKADGKYTADAPLMQQVQSYMVNEVLQTETLQRMVIDTCSTFNRLVAMLESRIKDENFWRETETLM